MSKRYNEAASQRDKKGFFPLENAVEILEKMPPAKFDETVELSITLLVDPRQSTQMVRGTLNLPHGSGKKVCVIVFTDKPDEAIDAGADHAGLADLIKKVQDGWTDFDVAVATPEAMKQVRSIARVLGPRGLMPNPKSGTVTDDVADAIKAVKAGRVEFKMDKTANMAVIVGKRSFTKDQLLENTQAAINVIGNSRPEGFKGRLIKSISISSSMSPGIRLENSLFTQF
ncbi:MAG: 50S ribosomal protein L1 [Opitutae bacterium]|jgi:large subunit ribosomal protein L1|nr:50S ribosomal protein L1 [Opitutae bacterium]MBT4225449.1 50S ribosomal protein L1 [Opitutae bacterium]MBT5377849.1 50S ribosomal protein L1 [Opitutae bacterium]MBT5692229.1 50S ribosomal protein L1 [Opitutae bacterium]MBT6463686.1 50S ribosomal protein L1 [Opitutae bacterium]